MPAAPGWFWTMIEGSPGMWLAELARQRARIEIVTAADGGTNDHAQLLAPEEVRDSARPRWHRTCRFERLSQAQSPRCLQSLDRLH